MQRHALIFLVTRRITDLEKTMGLPEILEDIRSRPTVPVWPHAGMALNLSRTSSYAAAKRKEIETIQIGRSIRVPTFWLRKKLGLE